MSRKLVSIDSPVTQLCPNIHLKIIISTIYIITPPDIGPNPSLNFPEDRVQRYDQIGVREVFKSMYGRQQGAEQQMN